MLNINNSNVWFFNVYKHLNTILVFLFMYLKVIFHWRWQWDILGWHLHGREAKQTWAHTPAYSHIEMKKIKEEEEEEELAGSNLIKFSFMEFFCTCMYALDLYSSYPAEESVWFLPSHLFLFLISINRSKTTKKKSKTWEI